jgi:hypothetical protein
LPTGPVNSIVGDPNNSNRIYAAVSSLSAATNAQTALFASNDAGVNWTQVFGAAQSGGSISAASQTVLKVASAPGGALAVGVVNLANCKLDGGCSSNETGVDADRPACNAPTFLSSSPPAQPASLALRAIVVKVA